MKVIEQTWCAATPAATRRAWSGRNTAHAEAAATITMPPTISAFLPTAIPSGFTQSGPNEGGQGRLPGQKAASQGRTPGVVRGTRARAPGRGPAEAGRGTVGSRSPGHRHAGEGAVRLPARASVRGSRPA